VLIATEADGEDVLRSAPTAASLQDLALVLAAAGIRHRLKRDGMGWHLVVARNDLESAVVAIEAYERERAPRSLAMPADYGKSWGGLVMAVVLVGCYLLTGPADPPTAWSRLGAASAEKILRGELWRTVTALTLHADPAHLLANTLACAVFGTAVARTLGPGLGGWLVLLAGAAGNGLNAVLHGAHHSAVGASTAVFGAIGLLGGLQFGRKRGERRAWIAVAGSLALLAMLGTSPHADILAHLFGLLVGLMLGVATAMTVRRAPGRALQWTLAATGIATVIGCWLLATRAL